MKTTRQLLLLLLVLTTGVTMYYILSSLPETWTVPALFDRLPPLPLFWRRVVLVAWIVIIGLWSYISIKRGEKKDSDEFHRKYNLKKLK